MEETKSQSQARTTADGGGDVRNRHVFRLPPAAGETKEREGSEEGEETRFPFLSRLPAAARSTFDAFFVYYYQHF